MGLTLGHGSSRIHKLISRSLWKSSMMSASVSEVEFLKRVFDRRVLGKLWKERSELLSVDGQILRFRRG
jgi:hypothetical protein